MNDLIHEITENVKAANTVSQKTSSIAESSKDVVKQSLSSMKEINESSQEIHKIIAVIKDANSVIFIFNTLKVLIDYIINLIIIRRAESSVPHHPGR